MGSLSQITRFMDSINFVSLGLGNALSVKNPNGGVTVYFKKALAKVQEFHFDWDAEQLGEAQVQLPMIIPPKYGARKW